MLVIFKKFQFFSFQSVWCIFIFFFPSRFFLSVSFNALIRHQPSLLFLFSGIFAQHHVRLATFANASRRDECGFAVAPRSFIVAETTVGYVGFSRDYAFPLRNGRSTHGLQSSIAATAVLDFPARIDGTAGLQDCPKIGQSVSNLSDLEITCSIPESRNRTVSKF